MKKIVFLILIVFALKVFGQITIETEMPEKIEAGTIFEVKLKIRNDYNQDIKIRLKDKIIINSNGINIECLEKTIKAKQETLFVYPSITISVPGDYNLGKPEIEYVNPKTKKTEKINSKDRQIKVTGKKLNALNKIETIYQCNGISSKSTQISTGTITTSITTNLPKTLVTQKQPANQKPAQKKSGQTTKNKSTENPELLEKNSLNQKNENQNNLFLATIIFLLALIAGFTAYKKYLENKTLKTQKKEDLKHENVSENQTILFKAIKEFEKGNKKEAYLMTGQAIRNLIKQKHGIKKEITQQEALKISKKQPYYKQLKKAFQLISMVGFARYKPNKKDFEYITKTAETIKKNSVYKNKC